MPWVVDSSVALGLTERVAAVGVVLGCLELLARPGTLRADGLLSWPVARLRSRRLSVGAPARALDVLLAPPGVQVVTTVRLLAGGAVLLAPTASAVSVVGLVVAAATTLLLMVRTSYGNDGADQMLLLVLIPCAAARLVGTERALEYAIWFVAAQCCLAYVTSGLGKLAGRSWRDGTGLVGVLGTATYGVPRLAALLRRHPALALALSWSVILSEVLFPLVFVVPDPVALAMLAGGLSFHLGSAAVMGLNAFVWAFGAAYPAIAYLVF